MIPVFYAQCVVVGAGQYPRMGEVDVVGVGTVRSRRERSRRDVRVGVWGTGGRWMGAASFWDLESSFAVAVSVRGPPNVSSGLHLKGPRST